METPGAARLFLALWPDPGVRHALCAWRDAWHWPRGATPVKTERLHLTLHFLGNVAPERIDELKQGLQVPFSPFEIALTHAQCWPHGIAVLAPDTVPPQLAALQLELQSALHTLGLATDARAFRPHVTLARRAGQAAPPVAGPPVHWKVRGYALMESRMGADGGYHILQHYD